MVIGIGGQHDVANVTNGMTLNNGTIMSNMQQAANGMPSILLNYRILVFPFTLNGTSLDGNRGVMLSQNGESINEVVTALGNCGVKPACGSWSLFLPSP